MTTQQYIDNLNQRFKLGNATEHTFRGDLQALVEHLLPGIQATNEPKRQACGAPDYILTHNKIEKGYIEAKDIGDKDLEGAKKTGNKLQFDRYKQALSNLLITDYLRFRLYREGEFVTEVKIGEVDGNRIVPIVANFSHFENLVKDFASYKGQTIKSPKKLAEMMAGKARLLSDVIENALNSDEINYENSTLKDQKLAFKQILIHDITPKGFADVYAQTIAYGMFAARLHDPTLPTFSRQEAAELIPKSNPFLRKLFGYIAGPDIDDRILWIVDSLVEIFLACNVEEILKNYGKATKMEDPIIHFYETFLSEYDPKLRKARGVWYTPAPVVNFIVRAVDEVLKTEFGLNQGLADTSKTTIKLNTQIADKRSATGYKQEEREVHRVQILDPATGTGTFLAEVVKHIYKKFEGQEGIWTNYVEQHLLPRLNGFELLMASYAMAHLQMDLLLKETGFKPMSNQRLRVYLTNSLEESHPDTGTLFANWLSTEANEANHIKTNTPVMCVIGNPPYSVSSSNKGVWIENLLKDYKKDLNEKNIQPLSDDYIKFIRYGQHYIEKNGSGVLAYISNNSFIDGLIHRQMRKNLLETFDKIYIVDLHGNSKKKEVSPDGSKDENVFDIMAGVSINIFVKTGKKKSTEYGQLFHTDLYGKREHKYQFLNTHSLKSISFEKLELPEPNLFFVPKDFSEFETYENGFKIDKIFNNYNTGIETGRDDFFVDFNNLNLTEKIQHVLLNLNDSNINTKYKITDTSSFKFKSNLSSVIFNKEKVSKILYRPFDTRYTYYDTSLQRRPSYNTIKHLFNNNLALTTCRQQSTFDFQHILITNQIIERCTVSLQTKETGYIFPLYLYPERTEQQSLEGKVERVPNLNMEIVREIEKSLGIDFVAEREEGNLCFAENVDELQDAYKASFAPIDLLDYIYAVLHSPAYREKYKEFLKIDFPRVPHPSDVSVFWQLVKLGGKLRRIHLLESEQVERYVTKYPIGGNNVVEKPMYKEGKVYLNETQYFEGVPEVAWNFYIGGYQPAQKWLKDRKGRALEFDDILHYQKIIVALMETDRLMKEIDMVGVVD